MCLRVGIRHQIEAIFGRQPHAHALGRPHRTDGAQDFIQQAHATLWAATISIRALITAIPQELVDQIAVGTVDLDAIEARSPGQFSGLLERLHHACYFACFERTRHDEVLHAGIGHRLPSGPQRGGRHG